MTAVGGIAAAGYVAVDGPAGGTFHEEVLRTTADLDAMLALAGVTGAGVGAHLEHYEIPEVPDTPEGAELPDTAQSPGDAPAAGDSGPAAAGDSGRAAAGEPGPAVAAEAGLGPHGPDNGLQILDSAARAAQSATPGMDGTAIIAGGGRRPE